jgi:hypothetical protein
MRISKKQIRGIIKKSMLSERKMLDIVVSKYDSAAEDINILANYALRDDMQGALNDPDLQYYIDKNEAGLLVDDSYGFLKYVGNEDYGPPAPEGWNLDDVYDFVKEFEDEAYRVFINKEKGDHAGLPNKVEREIIGNALTQSYVMPDEIKDIEFQIRRKGGKPMNINIEDDRIASNINHEEATRHGLTLDDIAKVLRDGGAKERKKQKPVKRTPPVYD